MFYSNAVKLAIPGTSKSVRTRSYSTPAMTLRIGCSKHVTADCSCSSLDLHKEAGSKNPILIWRVFRHFLTGFPLLDYLIVLEAKDVDQRNPRITRREPNPPMHCRQISVFQSTQR